MCRIRDALTERRAAQDGLATACLPHVSDPMALILDRGCDLDLNIPADMEALADLISEGETR